MERDKQITPEIVEAAKDIIAEAEAEGIIKDSGRRPYQRQPRYSNHSCLKFFGCLIVMIVGVLACAVFLTIYVTGPIVRTVKEIPTNFPKDLPIYQPNQAQVQVSPPESQTKIQQLSSALPGWILQILANYLYTDLKTQIMARNKSPENLPAEPTISDLPPQVDKNGQTVTLSWANINKTKEELYNYYKEKLEQKGFTVKELIQNNEIDLSFFKNNISGAMSIMDSFAKDGNSAVKMTVDYLNKQ